MLEENGQKSDIINPEMPTYISWAKNNPVEAEQLIHDSMRLLTVTEEKFEEIQNLPFFKRLKNRFSGNLTNQHLSISQSIFEIQRIGFQFMNHLQKEQLINARALIAIKNNLILLSVNQEEFAENIQDMVIKIKDNFNCIEDTMKAVKVQQSIHSWLLTIETCDYDEKFPEYLRLLKVLSDFSHLKNNGDGNNINELKYLQKAIKEVGISWKKEITLEEFINGLIDEIERTSFSIFESLLPTFESNIPHEFVEVNISTPSYKALFELANQYSHSSKTIDFIVKKLNISKSEALKEALLGFIGELGINLETPISIRELAVELHNCTTLTHQLFFIANSPDTILPTSDNDTTIEIDNTESEVTKIFAIDISLFSASLVVNDNGAITLLKVEDNYWIPSDSELKFRQAITELFLNFKSIADTYCKDGFYNVGLIIPSCFSSLQTLVIYDIVKSMEINYLFSTNRPVATAVAYYDDICTQDTTVICCDVRGGTIDMTILEVDQNDGYFTFEVLGKAGTFYDPQTNLRIKIIEILQQCLKDADMHADEINDLIVTGQHIDVQSVKSGLQDCIDKQAVKLIDSFITPLVGAVSKIAKCITGEMKNILILDVNNHSIGVETCDGSMLTILDRNTTIPTKQSSTVTTTQDNQTSMLIHIVEDKSCSTLNIASLGYFELTGIVPVSAGKAQIRITCDMDNEGVIKVTAEELGQLAFNTLTITSLEKELPSTPINLKAV